MLISNLKQHGIRLSFLVDADVQAHNPVPEARNAGFATFSPFLANNHVTTNAEKLHSLASRDFAKRSHVCLCAFKTRLTALQKRFITNFFQYQSSSLPLIVNGRYRNL